MADLATADLREWEDAPAARPYAPSGVDRLTDWVRRLPGPVAVFYLGVGISLVLLEWAIKWGDGTYQQVGIIPAALYHATLMLSGLYCLSSIPQLDDMAQTTLARFRPLLTGDAATQALLAWRLTILPARPALLAGIVGVLLALLMLWLTAPITHDQLHLFTSPAAAILEVVVWVGTWYFTSTFIYHTIHQARVIKQIYPAHAGGPL